MPEPASVQRFAVQRAGLDVDVLGGSVFGCHNQFLTILKIQGDLVEHRAGNQIDILPGVRVESQSVESVPCSHGAGVIVARHTIPCRSVLGRQDSPDNLGCLVRLSYISVQRRNKEAWLVGNLAQSDHLGVEQQLIPFARKAFPEIRVKTLCENIPAPVFSMRRFMS